MLKSAKMLRSSADQLLTFSSKMTKSLTQKAFIDNVCAIQGTKSSNMCADRQW